MDAIKVAACVLLAMLAVCDLRSRRLPNVWVAGLAALYTVEAAANGSTLFSLAAHAAAALISFTAAAVFVRLGWLAGGDAKLAAAVFFWCGPTYAMAVLVIVSACGTLVGLSMLIAGAVARRDAFGGIAKRLAWILPERGVPYGVALALGGIVAVTLQPTPAHRAALALLQPSFDPHAWLGLCARARLA